MMQLCLKHKYVYVYISILLSFSMFACFLITKDWAVRYWLSKGCPADKLVLGCAMYGRTFTLKDPVQQGLGAPATGAGQAGEFTRAQGFLSYYEVGSSKPVTKCLLCLVTGN